MIKGFEALNQLKDTAEACCGEFAVSSEDFDRGIFKEDEEAINTISRELKALEIISNKGINIWELRYSYSVNEYNICKGDTNKSLTQEEYDLLKGVFK